jgi:hypothetical protein
MEAIYFSNITNTIIIVSIYHSGDIIIRYSEKWGNWDQVIKKVAKDYILHSEYELIGYV